MPPVKSMMWRTDGPPKRTPTDLSTALEDAPTEGRDLISSAPSTEAGFRPPAPETLEDTGLCDTLVARCDGTLTLSTDEDHGGVTVEWWAPARRATTMAHSGV